MTKLKKILLISVLLNIVTSIYVVKKIHTKYFKSNKTEVFIPKQKEVKKEITYFLNRDELFNHLPLDKNSIVFLGNSLTQNFELSEFFKNRNIKNRGINGDIIEGVIKRLNPIIEAKPYKIFIEIGINDLANEKPRDTIINNYKKLIVILKDKLPKTQLYIQSIFPTELKNKNLPTYCGIKINTDIIYINKELILFSKTNNFTFIDTYSSFAFNGYLNKKYSVDGVHLNAEGYEMWTKILNPYIIQ